ALALPESADPVNGLTESGERRRNRQAHLIGQPVPYAGAEAERDSAGREAGQRRRLHRDERRVASRGIHYAEPDGRVARGRREGARERERSVLKIVLDE